jgi:heat shock protein HslJ
MKELSMNRRILWLVALLVLAAVLVAPAQAQSPAPCPNTRVIAAGDWLSKIAKQAYGDPAAYFPIVSATNAQAIVDKTFHFVDDPNRIRVGWKVCIPAVVTAPTGLTAADLANATYRSEVASSGQVTLKDGSYSEPAAPGSASQTTARLTNAIAYGEIGGVPSAAVVLVESGGGTGSFYSLHIVQAPDGKPVDVASVPLGDRVNVTSLAIVDGVAVVGMTTQGPNDPMPQPTQRVLNSYALNGDKLEMASTAVVGAATAPAVPKPAAGGEGMKGLTGAVWKWEKTQFNDGTSVTVADPNRYLVEFLANGSLAIKADCNQVGGRYTVDGKNLTIQLGPSTLAACPPDSQATEFLKELSEVASYRFADGKLILELKLDAGAMTFAGSSPTALAGKSWEVIGVNNGKQAVASVINGTTLTMDFGAGGQVSGSAGCNNYSGSYETNGDQIKFGPLAVTQKMCGEPEGVMGQEANFLKALQNAAKFKIAGNKLEIRSADGALQVSAVN